MSNGRYLTPAGLVLVIVATFVGACQAAAPSTLPGTPSAPASTGVPSPSSDAAGPATSTPAPGSLDGVWSGSLEDATSSYPVTMRFIDCAKGGACGDNEYAQPDDPSAVLCAAELTLAEPKADAFVATERMTFNPWACMATTLLLRPLANGSLSVEQYGDVNEPPFSTGTLTRTAPDARPTPIPVPATIEGIGTPTAALDLGGTTTQYTAEGFGSLWLPIDQGAVVRVDAATGVEVARIAIGDPGAVELKTDPHGVAVADDGVWVASAASHELVLVDPATNEVGRRIALAVEPYVLAIHDRQAWVTSFADDALLRVDLDSGKTTATVSVAKPTGVAFGARGVWVVEHRINTVVHVDPATAKVVARVKVGDSRPNELCGGCVENVIVSDGSVWTSDNYLRSVTRIDPATDTVDATIALPMRAWAVAAGGGRIWAGQFDPEVDQGDWMTASIDPATNAVTTYPLAAQSVSWAGDALWAVQPGRRSDVLVRVAVEP